MEMDQRRHFTRIEPLVEKILLRHIRTDQIANLGSFEGGFVPGGNRPHLLDRAGLRDLEIPTILLQSPLDSMVGAYFECVIMVRRRSEKGRRDPLAKLRQEKRHPKLPPEHPHLLHRRFCRHSLAQFKCT